LGSARQNGRGALPHAAGASGRVSLGRRPGFAEESEGPSPSSSRRFLVAVVARSARLGETLAVPGGLAAGHRWRPWRLDGV